MHQSISRGQGRMRSLTGYAAGIIAGVSYGLNPLFGKNLLDGGVPVYSLLFFRYIFAVAMMAAYMLAARRCQQISRRSQQISGKDQQTLYGLQTCNSQQSLSNLQTCNSRQSRDNQQTFNSQQTCKDQQSRNNLQPRNSLRISLRQLPLLIVLGLFFACSSIGLFESYNYIPAGLATTLIYLYPLFTATSMLLMGKSPSLKIWLTMAVTIAGVVLLCLPSGDIRLNWIGVAFAIFSAFSYAMYLVIVNNSSVIKDLSAQTITFYALVTGSVLFFLITALRGDSLVAGFQTVGDWANVIALSVFSTIIAMLSIAIATRKIGPTRTAVLGVFEPLTAILIGVLAFHETLTPTMILGIVVCIVAVTFMIALDR